MGSVEFHDAASKLSTTLLGVSGSLAGKASLRDLLGLIGEQGMLLVCVFLTQPFLLPVSIPGVSTVFGLAIILIAVGVTLNRVPWLPRRILDRPLSTAPLKQAFAKGARFVARFEQMVRPRWLFLTRTVAGNIVHGLALVLAGVLLPAFLAGGQLLLCEGGRPQGAFVEVRLVAEAERCVPRFEHGEVHWSSRRL